MEHAIPMRFIKIEYYGPKWCMNYDSGDYEWIDENGYSWDQGEYVYNWDRSAFDDDDDDDDW